MPTPSETLYHRPLLRRILDRGDALLPLPAAHDTKPLPDDRLVELHRAAFAERGEAAADIFPPHSHGPVAGEGLRTP